MSTANGATTASCVVDFNLDQELFLATGAAFGLLAYGKKEQIAEGRVSATMIIEIIMGAPVEQEPETASFARSVTMRLTSGQNVIFHLVRDEPDQPWELADRFYLPTGNGFHVYDMPEPVKQRYDALRG